MATTETFQVTTPSDREIAVIRVFDAPRHLVFEALTTPELLKRWLGVHNNWWLDTCEIDLKVGGTFRYVWKNSSGAVMGMRGVFREIVRPERIVNTEKFDDPWYPGDEWAYKYTEFKPDESNALLDALGYTKRDAEGYRLMMQMARPRKPRWRRLRLPPPMCSQP